MFYDNALYKFTLHYIHNLLAGSPSSEQEDFVGAHFYYSYVLANDNQQILTGLELSLMVALPK